MVPAVALGLLFPFVLMLLALLMERVERPVTGDSLVDQLELFLATAKPEEVETFVRGGYAVALEMYWRRRSRRVDQPIRFHSLWSGNRPPHSETRGDNA